MANQERHVLWAVCCTTFFGFFRLGELLQSSCTKFNPRLHLFWGDMAIDNHSIENSLTPVDRPTWPRCGHNNRQDGL